MDLIALALIVPGFVAGTISGIAGVICGVLSLNVSIGVLAAVVSGMILLAGRSRFTVGAISGLCGGLAIGISLGDAPNKVAAMISAVVLGAILGTAAAILSQFAERIACREIRRVIPKSPAQRLQPWIRVCVGGYIVDFAAFGLAGIMLAFSHVRLLSLVGGILAGVTFGVLVGIVRALVRDQALSPNGGARDVSTTEQLDSVRFERLWPALKVALLRKVLWAVGMGIAFGSIAESIAQFFPKVFAWFVGGLILALCGATIEYLVQKRTSLVDGALSGPGEETRAVALEVAARDGGSTDFRDPVEPKRSQLLG